MSIYDFTVKDITGNDISMSEYKGKIILIVNTASQCGLVQQYKSLQELYEKYKDQNFEILGFPCNQFKEQEKESNGKIQEFCSLNYGVTFKMFSKINVNGEDADPLFKYLKQQKRGLISSNIKWNFTKFLVDKEGNVINRFAPITKPETIENYIKMLL